MFFLVLLSFILGQDTNNQGFFSRVPLVITGRARDGRLIALTFDDGPDIVTTPILLEALDQFNIKATFFVVGKRIANSWRAREVLEETFLRGHTIGNHSFSHPIMSKLPPEKQVKEIYVTQQLVKNIIGKKTRIYRPPYGVLTRYIRGWLAKKGYTIIMWNMDSNDPFDFSAAHAFEYVMKYVNRKLGGVLLFHDTHIWSVSAVPAIIQEVMRKNCELIDKGEPPIYFTRLDRFGVRKGGREAFPTQEEINKAEEQYQKILSYCKELDAEALR